MCATGSASRLRRAIRFVFRDHPELARQAGSDYERRQRAARRRSAAQPAGEVEVERPGAVD